MESGEYRWSEVEIGRVLFRVTHGLSDPEKVKVVGREGVCHCCERYKQKEKNQKSEM